MPSWHLIKLPVLKKNLLHFSLVPGETRIEGEQIITAFGTMVSQARVWLQKQHADSPSCLNIHSGNGSLSFSWARRRYAAERSASGAPDP